MDRLNQLRGEAGGSKDSTLDTSAAPSEAYITANESSKYFSLTEDESSFDITPIKDVSLASTVETEKTGTEADQLISNLSPIAKKRDSMDGYKIGKQIEAANILSGGVDIFDDNDNSYDGDELVIDDNADIEDKSNSELKLVENPDLPFQKSEEVTENLVAIGSKDTEVVLQIDGKNVNAIDIGNGLYLYRKAGEEELAAVQIVADDHDQPSFKFLKVRENAEGNLEVYEEIEIEVPKEIPAKDDKFEKNISHVPVKDNNQIKNEPTCKVAEKKKPQEEQPIASTSDSDEVNKIILSETKPEINLNGKMMKYNETRKSPVIHSTPNKEGIPLTKTMVNMQLHPSRPLDKVKTIEVHTDNIKQRTTDITLKSKHPTDDQKGCVAKSKEIDKPIKVFENIGQSKEEQKIGDMGNPDKKQKESVMPEKVRIQVTDSCKDKNITSPTDTKAKDDKKIETTEEKKDKEPADVIKSGNLKCEQHKEDTDKSIEQKPKELKEHSEKLNNDKNGINPIEKPHEQIETSILKSNIDSSHKESQIDLKSEQIAEKVSTFPLDPKTVKESDIKQKSVLKDKKQEDNPVALTQAVLDTSKKVDENLPAKPEDSQQVISEEGIATDVKNENSNTIIATEKSTKIVIKGKDAEKDVTASLQQMPSNNTKPDTKITPSVNNSHVLSDFSNKCEIVKQNIEQESTTKPNEINLKHDLVAEDGKNAKLTIACDVDILETKEINMNLKSLEPPKPIISDTIKDNLIIETSVNKPEVISKEPVAVNKNILEDMGKKDSKQQESIETKSDLKKQNEQQVKSELKPNKLPSVFPVGSQRKTENSKIPCSVVEKKPAINNNAAVPFGQWTSVDRKEFLDKIKEAKAPVNASNSKPISKPNDLNRRDVLQKIDSQRQSSNAASKTHEYAKLNIKNETPTFTNKSTINQPKITKESKVHLKVEAQSLKNPPAPKKVEIPTAGENIYKTQPKCTVTSTYAAKKAELPTSGENIYKTQSKSTVTSNFPAKKAEIPTPGENTYKTQSKPTVTTTFSAKKVEIPTSGENIHKILSKTALPSTYPAKLEGPKRNEFNNQDLIDKTVEGIINRVVSTKHQDINSNKPKEPMKTQTSFASSYKSRDSKPSILDAIEMKMNELHGIPFVERPPHELPKVYNRDIKTYGKTDNAKVPTDKVNQIPTLLPVSKYQHKVVKNDVIDLDSEEEVIEHEPITGDIDLHNRYISTSKQSNTSAETNMAQIGSDSSKKESIITERDFDKFVRRNSITYENCLTVNIEKNKNRNVVQGLILKNADKTSKKEMPEAKISSPNQKPTELHNPNNFRATSKSVPVGEDAFNKNYHSKIQLAYQTALTTKRQMESPVTILEDKPVKVVFIEGNSNFQVCQTSIQGQSLSPSKKQLVPKESDPVTVSTYDPVDSELLDTIEDIKPQDEIKSNKTKHQRKQVLTPVETPELELIVPGDLGIEVSPKKKRRMDDIKLDKSPRSVVPKKSYLLGRNAHTENPAPPDLVKDVSAELSEEKKDVMISHNNTASAIDNLVKAAELIENQSGNFKSNSDITVSDNATSITPAKRGRGRPRKYPLPDGAQNASKAPSPQKKPRLTDVKQKPYAKKSSSDEDNSNDSSDDSMVRENWTMGKINQKIVCPICHKLFRSENVVFKHVKHCTGPSPNRSDSDKRSSRRSRLSHDSKSMDSKLDDTDGETDSLISKKSTPKRLKSKELSSDGKEDIIVIEDTPVKTKAERSVEPKQHESRKPTKTKAEYKSSTLACEYCGKTFRQLSYLVSHKLLHKKENLKTETQTGEKTVFSCEVCKKEFRKLHHLVQHRFIHASSKSSRKSSFEQDIEHKASRDKEIKQAEDQSAAFRCEPCDKSFRKLHHLVEHRETHDGINRQKGTPAAQNTEKVIQNPPLPPQCDVCKKTFRKLHHLIEHKEQHHETASEISDDKSVKSALSTKDIIHECSLCYMVFPNEHSLNKHSVFCQRKKRQPAKQSKPINETVPENETPIEKENDTLEPIVSNLNEVIITDITKNDVVVSEKETEVDLTVEVPKATENTGSVEEYHMELPIIPKITEIEKTDTSPVEAIKDTPPELPQELKISEISKCEPINTTKMPKKSIPKEVSAAKRRKSNLPLARIKESIALESSDDDDVLYMFNPEYKDSSQKPDTVESFMKVKAKKRNSLQFERPNSKDLIKRRTSLQNLAKVPRIKAKITESDNSAAQTLQPNISNPSKSESIDSDDSDVKYSFPDVVPQSSNYVKPPKEKRQSVTEKVQKTEPEKTPKDNKRKSLAEKRKSLVGIAKRKSLGKIKLVKQTEKATPMKEVKRRRVEVEHRCDCGQLYSSAALLARHMSLAHTPPRVRRRRTASPPPAPSTTPARKTKNPTESRKSSTRSDTHNTAPKKPGRPSKSSTRTPVSKLKKEDAKVAAAGLQSSRKMSAHRGVPVPEKMKKIIEKLK